MKDKTHPGSIRNIKLIIQYDGTNYSGWQYQKNAESIQGVITRAAQKITGERINLIGSGRTDAGVHARMQVANFKTRSKIPLENLRMALNSVLPDDIIVSGIQEVGMGFNARRHARSKLYCYTIVNSPFVDPFIRHFAARCFYKLDIRKMRRSARYLEGRHDFRSFQAKDARTPDPVRTVKYIRIEKKGRLVYIYIEADGFLYNMARNIVGTLVEAGRGKIDTAAVKHILLKKDRRFCGPTMPAEGLCLVRVRY